MCSACFCGSDSVLSDPFAGFVSIAPLKAFRRQGTSQTWALGKQALSDGWAIRALSQTCHIQKDHSKHGGGSSPDSQASLSEILIVKVWDPLHWGHTWATRNEHLGDPPCILGSFSNHVWSSQLCDRLEPESVGGWSRGGECKRVSLICEAFLVTVPLTEAEGLAHQPGIFHSLKALPELAAHQPAEGGQGQRRGTEAAVHLWWKPTLGCL